MPIKSYVRKTSQFQWQWLVASIADCKPDTCLLWPFWVNNKGYGSVKFNGGKVQSHRLAFFLTYGHWPTPMGCHKCDVPACCNPSHIFEGTAKDNAQDAVRKGRVKRGCSGSTHARVGKSGCRCSGGAIKLTPEMVIAIRGEYAKYKHGISGGALGRKYGVSKNMIWRIATRKSWTHI